MLEQGIPKFVPERRWFGVSVCILPWNRISRSIHIIRWDTKIYSFIF